MKPSPTDTEPIMDKGCTEVRVCGDGGGREGGNGVDIAQRKQSSGFDRGEGGGRNLITVAKKTRLARVTK